MKQAVAHIISNRKITSDYYLMQLESPEIAAEARSGQFVMVHCGEDTLLRRPFSIHQRAGSKIALLFQVVGKGTAWLAQRKTGDEVDVFGPLGNGYSIQSNAHNLLLVAGGIGIAPLRFLIDEAVTEGKKVILLMGASSAVNLLSEGQLTHGLLADRVLPFNINIIKMTEDGSEGFKGLATDVIIDYVERVDQIFACGPLPMYKAMAQMPELKGKSAQVSLEVRMGCGLGVCYGCTIKTKRGLRQVCQDGPVFELEDIIWDD